MGGMDDYITADKLNDDGVLKLCKTILKDFMTEYRIISSGGKPVDKTYMAALYWEDFTVDRCKDILRTPFYQSMLAVAGVSPEDVIKEIERQ